MEKSSEAFLVAQRLRRAVPTESQSPSTSFNVTMSMVVTLARL